MPPRTLDEMSDAELDSYIQWIEMFDEIRLEQAQPGVAVVVPKEKKEEIYEEPNKNVD